MMKDHMFNDKNQLKTFKDNLIRFMMLYKFALSEMNTKIDILKQEFQYIHDYNPIEHVKSRLKTPESILKKIKRKGCDTTLSSIRENIQDIAGIRITCSFISDIYEISRMLQQQKDVEVVTYKDYIKNPKPNGYRSLHMIIRIPIYMSDRVEHVFVEIQIRTIAMDFWSSLEHKIYYKYDKEIPQRIKDDLKEAADSTTKLDLKMENLHKEMSALKQTSSQEEEGPFELLINDERFYLPQDFLSSAILNQDNDES